MYSWVLKKNPWILLCNMLEPFISCDGERFNEALHFPYPIRTEIPSFCIWEASPVVGFFNTLTLFMDSSIIWPPSFPDCLTFEIALVFLDPLLSLPPLLSPIPLTVEKKIHHTHTYADMYVRPNKGHVQLSIRHNWKSTVC
jgi:hypothetical protein